MSWKAGQQALQLYQTQNSSAALQLWQHLVDVTEGTATDALVAFPTVRWHLQWLLPIVVIYSLYRIGRHWL